MLYILYRHVNYTANPESNITHSNRLFILWKKDICQKRGRPGF